MTVGLEEGAVGWGPLDLLEVFAITAEPSIWPSGQSLLPTLFQTIEKFSQGLRPIRAKPTSAKTNFGQANFGPNQVLARRSYTNFGQTEFGQSKFGQEKFDQENIGQTGLCTCCAPNCAIPAPARPPSPGPPKISCILGAAGVSHDSPRTPNVHICGSWRFKHHQNSTRRLPERGKNERKLWQEMEKSAKFLGPTLWARPFGSPPPSVPPTVKTKSGQTWCWPNLVSPVPRPFQEVFFQESECGFLSAVGLIPVFLEENLRPLDQKSRSFGDLWASCSPDCGAEWLPTKSVLLLHSLFVKLSVARQPKLVLLFEFLGILSLMPSVVFSFNTHIRFYATSPSCNEVVA